MEADILAPNWRQAINTNHADSQDTRVKRDVYIIK